MQVLGGWNSGRYGGRPIVEQSLIIDIGYMLRKRLVSDGAASRFGNLSWTRGGEHHASIGYEYDMRDCDDAWLKLKFTTKRNGGESVDHEQHVRLSYTIPHFGGRRWWLHCPKTGRRVGKLHVPAGGDVFASRAAWRLGYSSQRKGANDQPFERLFKLQRKLGCAQGWEAGLYRPKGMWHRTFERHFERYLQLDNECAATMLGVFNRLGVRVGRA